MGHEIVYCVKCATKIPGVDFERGKAFKIGGKAVCAVCLPSLSLEEQKEASLSSTRVRAMKSSPPQGTSVRISLPPRADAPPSSSMSMIVLCGGGVLMALEDGGEIGRAHV